MGKGCTLAEPELSVILAPPTTPSWFLGRISRWDGESLVLGCGLTV